MSIKAMVDDIIAKEGGYINHPADRGGPTKYGITKAAYADYFNRSIGTVSTTEIKRLLKSTAEKIYLKNYYVAPNINLLQSAIQPIIFDMAVNHGPVRAIKILQKTLDANGYYPGGIDGLIGRRTISAAESALSDLGHRVISILVDARVDYYRKIVAHDPSQSIFINGWENRAESFRPAVA